MTINEQVISIANDIRRQAERLALYQRMGDVFAGLTWPRGMQCYFCEYQGDEEIYGNFSAGYRDGDAKDLRPFIHALARKFRTKFRKQHNYDKTAIEYSATFERDGVKYRVKVDGVLPTSCRLVEREIPLSDEEIAEAKAKALASVKTVRVEREIVCKPAGQHVAAEVSI